MKRLAPTSLAAVVSLLSAASAQGGGTEVHGNTTFQPPQGYQLTREKDGFVRMRMEKEKEWLEIRVLRGAKLEGKVEDHVDRFLELVRQNNPKEFRIDIPRTSKRPKNAERVSNAGASAENPNEAGTYSYFLVWCYLAGWRVETVVVNTNSPRLYTTQQPTIETFLNGLKFTSSKVLVAGKPPLTRFTSERTVGFVEWLLEIPMTDAQRSAIQQELVDSWKKEDRETIDSTTELVDAVDEIASKSEDERRAVRLVLRDKVLTEWRKSKEPVERMLLGVWDAAHQPLIPGNPPLTQQLCDGTAESYYLMACAVAGVALKTPDKDLLAKWTTLMKERYPLLPKDAKEALQQMPIFAAAIRAGWNDIPEAERKAYVTQWKEIPGIVELGNQLAADARKNLFETQARIQASNLHFQMMSNIMRSQHETSMTIIRNMGSSNWHYVYRY